MGGVFPSDEERDRLIARIKANDDRERIRGLLRGRESLRDFIVRIEPRHPPPRHLAKVIDAIERARLKPVRICISMPPGHAKSITLQRGVAWWLQNTPADTCGYFGYNDDIGCRASNIIRGIAREVGVPFAGANTANEWRLQGGGGLVAGGIGTSLTGRRITGLMVVDDPIKDRKEADSVTSRQDCWDWFASVVLTRLEGASVIVLHTRWHPDDLIGRLEKLGGWEIINIPALCDKQPDPLDRELGEALWPAQYPVPYLKELERTIGEYEFSALFQGCPRPRGAAVFGPPHYYNPATFSPTGCTAVIGADPAASMRTKADYSVGACLLMKGKYSERMTWIRNVIRQQTTVPNFARSLRAFQMSNWLAPVYVESVGGFKSVKQILEELDPKLTVYEAPTLGDKFQRALPLAAAWNDGRVLVPENAPWLKDFLHEFEQFTGVGDAHDDQIDSCSHAFNAIATADPPVVRRSVADPSRYRS